MSEPTKESRKYFNEALSDFVYDAASGRAIRHLVDNGYTTDQILKQLDYPTSRKKVEKTVYRYLKESGILLDELPIPCAQMRHIVLGAKKESEIFSHLAQRASENGEENSYIACPFGIMHNSPATDILSLLTTREREYILGIAWEPKVMYHKLNRRMLEIGVILAANSDAFSFYFLKSREIISLSKQK